MMHYEKGENIEKQLTKEELPFNDVLPKNKEFLWMHVNGGTKVKNVLNYVKRALDNGEHKHIVWSGSGGGVIKAISCAEILKNSYALYQVTRMCYSTVEEHWKPKLEGLEEIVVNRQIPSLHIFMSLEPIDDNVTGLQKPGTKTSFCTYDNAQEKPSTSSNNNPYKDRNRNQRRPYHNKNKKSRQPQAESKNNADQANEPSSSGID